MTPKSTEEHRERAYTDWLTRLELDDNPERRELWFRRFRRPQPPAGMPIKTSSQIRGEHLRWAPVVQTESETAA